ncbi:hypothetical protein CF336_g8983 [Tilletia laevis]|nr:hypothetical protein CF336_g8983 [Tilletia laevis]CAD7062297.1 unnamed protein product [Tilletia caries]
MYSLLASVPGGIGILEGTVYGPRYLSPDDLSSHPFYDHALDIELGQAILALIEGEVMGHIMKSQSDGEVRGSIYYRELRNALQPSVGYGAMILDDKIAKATQKDGETVRKFGERLRGMFFDIQGAGDPVAPHKKVMHFLRGLNPRFHTARNELIHKQSTGQGVDFDTALRIVAEAEQAYGALMQPRSAPRVPYLARPTANAVVEECVRCFPSREDGQEDDEDQALAAGWQPRREDRAPRPFTKNCFCCRKTGHRAAECPHVPVDDVPTQPRAVVRPHKAMVAVANPSDEECRPCTHAHAPPEEAVASMAMAFPAFGSVEAQEWKDQIVSWPAALSVVHSE